jgi:mannosyltransferase OCH1-like enzyme
MFNFRNKSNNNKNNNNNNEKLIEKSKSIKYILKSKINFIPKWEFNSIIPLNVYTCWHTKNLPPLMKANFEKLKSDNPRLTFHLYDENDCREFIKINFKEDVLNSYDSLIPCSYKSDLWRYCVLFINGGIYLDIKFECFNNFKLITLTESEHFVRDRDPPGGTLTGLIVSKPGNVILFNCIRQIVDNVKNKFYGENSLYPTGPCLLGKYFTKNEKKQMELFFDNAYAYGKDNYYIGYKNNICDIIILKMYDEYRNEQKIYQKNPYYADLWAKKKIYK